MKYYSCPLCEVISSAESWNKFTINKYGSDIGLIQTEEKDELLYICPDCEDVCDGEDIKFAWEIDLKENNNKQRKEN